MFLNEQTHFKGTCYKCVYQIKYSVKKVKYCRVCKSVNNSSRAVYCSNECAKIGEKEIRSKHWTRKMGTNSQNKWGYFSIRNYNQY